MKVERSILVSFLGNYVTNTVVAAFVALIPASASTGFFTPQYLSYIVIAAIVVAIFTWWYRARGWKDGLAFGIIGFIVSILTAFVTGVCGVLAQTGSLGQMASVIPNFGPFLWSWTTLWLLGYWVIPAVIVGYFSAPKAAAPVNQGM